jgi:8-oxo-dGTP diphosphatase
MGESLRAQIRDEIERLRPGDELERSQITDALAWLDSGADLFRVQKPATPPRHLVSYFVCTDGRDILLTDHINAELWLPTGGHVEPGEHPRETVKREAREELGIEARPLFAEPLMLSISQTQGSQTRHTDVSLWYVLHLSRDQPLTPDPSEFHSVRWFAPEDVPLDRSDPHIGRFLRKLSQARSRL